MSQCAFCGHPDAAHRVADAICERIEAGEPRAEVLADYGWTEERLADWLEWDDETDETVFTREHP